MQPLAITMGDPSGVGPEILIRAHLDGALKHDWVVFGDLSALELARSTLSLGALINPINDVSDFIHSAINVIDFQSILLKPNMIGRISAASGEASVRYIEKAARSVLDGTYSAVVTLPVNKEAVRLTHPNFTGHTELIADICGTDRYTMMLWSPSLIVTHVTTHVPFIDVPGLITTERVHDTISLTHDALLRLKPRPRIAVSALNPHAGEGGAFGSHEADIIAPAVSRAAQSGISVTGPYPPDTVFLRAHRGEFDAVVCMYHDQGHIPIKLLDFGGGVNVTLGLPIIRTSVDHGTAFDIAYKGIADTTSFINAFNLAASMAGER